MIGHKGRHGDGISLRGLKLLDIILGLKVKVENDRVENQKEES